MLTVLQMYNKLNEKCEQATKTIPPVISKKILIVDDVEVNQKLLERILSSHECVLASNGEEAVAKFKEAANTSAPFDFVLMDLEMPIMDGQIAATEIRKLPKGLTTPIFCVSSKVKNSESLEEHASAMDSFLLKPVNRKALEILMNTPIKPVFRTLLTQEITIKSNCVSSSSLVSAPQKLTLLSDSLPIPAIKSPRASYNPSYFNPSFLPDSPSLGGASSSSNTEMPLFNLSEHPVEKQAVLVC